MPDLKNSQLAGEQNANPYGSGWRAAYHTGFQAGAKIAAAEMKQKRELEYDDLKKRMEALGEAFAALKAQLEKEL